MKIHKSVYREYKKFILTALCGKSIISFGSHVISHRTYHQT